MTTEEYLTTPESLVPVELAYGTLRVAESPGVSHQRLVGRLFLAMAPIAAERRLGEVLLAPMDVVLDRARHLVVQPDLVFVSHEREDLVGDRIFGAPDLAVEVLSPRPRVGALEEHLAWFATYGVRECWVVDQRRQECAVLVLNHHGVVERRLSRAGRPIVSDVLPGVVLPL